MTKKTTIKDIAKVVGVTPATVSNVLNGTKRYSDETKKRILLVAEQLNYTPNMSARALVKKRTYNIGLFIPASPQIFLDPYFSELLRGLTEVALQQRYVVSIIYSDGLDESIRNRVDGLVLTEVKLDDEYIQYFRKLNIPFVVLANGEKHGVKDFIVSDTKKGIEDAIQYLFNLGHRRFGYALGPVSYEYVHDRFEFFQEILKEMDIDPDPSNVAKGLNSREGGSKAAKVIMSSTTRPTAILASTDIIALGVIDYLKCIGCHVPKDVSVVGFDDANFSEYVNPTITTIRHEIYEHGRYAAQMLISKLEGRKYEHPMILPVKFIVRESVASPKEY